MRQIYTSPRTANVDRVVELLGQAGIQTSVTNRRAWAGHDYRGPSYAGKQDPGTWPQVWVVKAEDQPRARALLREAGVEPATRYAEELAQWRSSQTSGSGLSLRAWLRIGLLATIALLISLHWFHIL